MMRAEASDQSGAVAITVAVSALMLFGVAALAVDLGNGMARKRDVQSQADLAALAAAGSLPGTKAASNASVMAAAAYLNHNQPQSDGASCAATETCVIAAQLVDGNDANGEIYFESSTRVRVIAPPARVQFGLANAIGFNNLDVRAEATAGIFSAGPPVMPVYAAYSCSWGPQSITAPASGGTPGTTPILYAPTDTNKSNLDPRGNPPSNPNPSRVDLNPAAGTLTITGDKLAEVTKVGFFADGGAPPIQVDVVTASNSAVTVAYPITGVTDSEGLWWIRVWGPGNGNNAPSAWSAVQANNGTLETVPFQVGDPYLRCAATSSDGNYGTLKLPRTDVTNSTSGGWLAHNMALGLQDPLSLAIYPGSPNVTATCAPNDPDPTVFSTTTGNPTLKRRTNCVQTDPGLSSNAASAGLITGPSDAVGGRLAKPTTEQCDPDGGSDERTVVINGASGDKTYVINDDILTCFFKSSSATVGDVSKPTWTGSAVISDEIFSSPRFFWQPVLKQIPTSGSSEYKIIDMRPAFLTGQPATAKKGDPQVEPENGVKIVNKAVDELQVVFLNFRAIEQPDGGPVIDWLGGDLPKLVRLVN